MVRIKCLTDCALAPGACCTSSPWTALRRSSTSRCWYTRAVNLGALCPRMRYVTNSGTALRARRVAAVCRRACRSSLRPAASTWSTRATAHQTCAFLADLAGVLTNGGVVERITAVRKCVASIVYDSEARTAALRLFRVPGGNFRGGFAELTLSIPSTLRQPGRRAPSQTRPRTSVNEDRM